MSCLMGQTSELTGSEGWVVQTTDMRDPYCQRSQRKESKRRIEMKHARQHLHDAVLDQTMLENRKEKLILTKHPNMQEPIIQLIIPTSPTPHPPTFLALPRLLSPFPTWMKHALPRFQSLERSQVPTIFSSKGGFVVFHRQVIADRQSVIIGFRGRNEVCCRCSEPDLYWS